MPTREEMVADQLRDRGISDERVLAAMGAVPREQFVAPRLADAAYDDRALPIGRGQTLSQPWVLAAICQALELRGGERVLEVGGGSGYSAAVLGQLAASVVSYELIDELAATAVQRLTGLGIANVELRTGDGAAAQEAAAEEGFDAIAVHAVAPALPATLVERLRGGGRLVAPVEAGDDGEVLRLYKRVGVDRRDGSIMLKSTDIAHVSFVPLLGEAGYDAA